MLLPRTPPGRRLIFLAAGGWARGHLFSLDVRGAFIQGLSVSIIGITVFCDVRAAADE